MPTEFTRRRLVATLGSAVAAGSLAGCSGDGGGDEPTEAGDGSTVAMTGNLAFEPAELTVSTGTTVTWENVGRVAHSVTAYEAEIPEGAAYFASGGYDSEQAAREGYVATDPDSGAIQGGGTYEHTFETAGTYEYFCLPHESTMVGTITVEES